MGWDLLFAIYAQYLLYSRLFFTDPIALTIYSLFFAHIRSLYSVLLTTLLRSSVPSTPYIRYYVLRACSIATLSSRLYSFATLSRYYEYYVLFVPPSLRSVGTTSTTYSSYLLRYATVRQSIGW